MDSNELMWSTAAADSTAEHNQRVYAVAKVAAQQASWSFLSAAASPAEYTARYALVHDRIVEAVNKVSPEDDTALLDQVTTSLREDWMMLAEAKRTEQIKALANQWCADNGPLFELATTGACTDLQMLDVEVTALSYPANTEERAELAQMLRFCGREPNFTSEAASPIADSINDFQDAAKNARHCKICGGVENHLAPSNRPVHLKEPDDGHAFKVASKTAAEIDPSDVPREFSQAAYDAGHADGLYNDNAGLEEFGQHPDYQRGKESGLEEIQDQKMQPELYHEESKTAETHAPYYIAQEGGKYKVVNSIGEVKGTHDSKEDALKQQAALYTNVPGAQQDAEEHHGKPRPKAVQDQGRKPAAKTSKYNYIRERDGKWEIWQKDTGKTLSTHDSKEKAEEAFRGMMNSMHGGAKWGFLDKEGVFHEVAVNESAFGAERYQHTPAPAVPSWINDEFFDHEVVALGDTPVKNNADGDELKPTAPWLVAEESLRTNPVSVVNTLTHNAASTLTWNMPATLTVSADASNPFSFQGPGNPDSTQSPVDTSNMPSPADDMSVMNPTGDPGAGLDPTNPSISPDATSFDPSMNTLAPDMSNLPAPADAQTGLTDPTTSSPNMATSSRFTSPTEAVLDKLAASVRAANPGLTFKQCIALAERTIRNHPEMVQDAK